IRFWRWCLAAAFVGFLAGASLLATGAFTAPPGFPIELFVLPPYVALLLGLVATVRLFVVRCPACRRLMFFTWYMYYPFARKCLRCAISLRYRPHRCQFCGYDLRCSPGPICPECGKSRDKIAKA